MASLTPSRFSVFGWITKRPSFQRWIQKRGPLAPPFQIAYRQVYILPTRFGVTFGALLLAMLLGALNYNNNAALLLSFLLATAAQLSTFRTWRNLAGLHIGRVYVQPVFAQETAIFRLNLHEQEGLERPILELDAGSDTDGSAIPGITLAAQQNDILEVPIDTRERGWLECPRLRISSLYPLGLFRAWSWVHPEQRCLVYPALINNAPPLPQPSSGDGKRNLQSEPDADFAGLRDYRKGDHIKDIAWKATARMSQLISREDPPTSYSEHMFKLTQTGVQEPERALSILTTWIVLADQRGLQYGLSLPGLELSPGNGEAHRHECLKGLALWQS